MRRFGAVVEDSPWVAEQVWDRYPTAARGGKFQVLADAFAQVIRAAPHEKKIEILRAHPDLACAVGSSQELTNASRDEQQGAGLDQCSPEEFTEFQNLNAQYRARFGFPFIIAVKGLDRKEILERFRGRIKHEPDEEFATALENVIRITGFRIADALADMAELPDNPPRALDFTHRYINLAQPRIGAAVVCASDEFFASRERLIDPAPPVFRAEAYDEHGKWMDGWESRRRRDQGHDWCMVRLCPGIIRGLDIDTSFFTGNYPPAASIDACRNFEADPDPRDDSQWQPLVERTPLQGDSHLFLEVHDDRVWTHLRLNIFPDGGLARLRVYGIVHRDWSHHDANEKIDLVALVNGGRALACNDMHFGHMSNLILPGESLNMGDGWETRRRREPGNDWVILRLGHPGRLCHASLDTQWFKGNYPDACTLYGAFLPDVDEATISPELDAWKQILPRSKLGPDQEHNFEALKDVGTVSHVRLDIHPDGGVSRLRLYGYRDPEFTALA